MTKKLTAKKAAKKKPVAKAKTAKPAKKAKPSTRKAVPAQDVADFICQPGGASMAELEAKFGIDAHPMRAKIHYVRHQLGYAVETKEGRYHGTAPKEAK